MFMRPSYCATSCRSIRRLWPPVARPFFRDCVPRLLGAGGEAFRAPRPWPLPPLPLLATDNLGSADPIRTGNRERRFDGLLDHTWMNTEFLRKRYLTTSLPLIANLRAGPGPDPPPSVLRSCFHSAPGHCSTCPTRHGSSSYRPHPPRLISGGHGCGRRSAGLDFGAAGDCAILGLDRPTGGQQSQPPTRDTTAGRSTSRMASIRVFISFSFPRSLASESL